VKHWTLAVFLTLLLAGCAKQANPDPVLGEAFVGPVTLQVRDALAMRAGLVATINHGDPVDIIGQRRRFCRIRTKSGAEGWVDGGQLLSPDDMKAIKQLAERAAGAPAQGRATAFELLNVHTIPNRQAPSFFQVTPDAQADVIAHQRVRRTVFEPPELIRTLPAAPPSARKKKAPPVPPPPAGRPPALPADWMTLSGRPGGVIPPPASVKKPATPPVPASLPASGPPMEDWTLIRAKDGRTGWVLTRLLLMSVPDEVAQYAERARISAYFSLGTINDQGSAKPVWLWATLSARGADYDFDSLRIFIWSTRRHRYETSFIERNMRGYLPLRLQGQPGAGVNSFRVTVDEKSGTRTEREYAVQGYRARLAGRRPPAQEEPWYSAPSKKRGGGTPPQAPEADWSGRTKGLIEELKGYLKR
jgi:hypothetical protein